MYTYRQLENNRPVIIHDETGCSIPYHSKVRKYKDGDIPDYKSTYFEVWLAMSNSARERVKKNSMAITDRFVTDYITPTTVSLAPLGVATASDWIVKYDYWMAELKAKQEGKTPMRYNDNYACASVTTAKSDAATQRDYLIGRLESAVRNKRIELDKFFNRFVDNTPKTYKELIDAIKNDKFTLDTKVTARVDAIHEDDDFGYCGGNPFYGIVWSGPVFDEKAWQAGKEAAGKQETAAKDIIMTGTAADGLAALQAFEAWLPAATAPTTATVQ